MKVKFKIIETPDYILAVSDEEIKESDYLYFWNGQSGTIHKLKENQSSDNMYGSGLKIIAYRPKNDAPELDLPLLPEMIVDDRENLADITWEPFKAIDGSCEKGEYEHWLFMQGFKTATKVYSEEDLMKAIMMSATSNTDFLPDRCEEIIQSLKQPKAPKWFVAETQMFWNRNTDRSVPTKDDLDEVLKTTTINSKTYLIGTYKYE